MKNYVGFPCHDRRSTILGPPYTGKVPTQPFSSILKAINGTIPSSGKKINNSNLRGKLL
jgi:hypothetical protein